jgi:hypothetical protein
MEKGILYLTSTELEQLLGYVEYCERVGFYYKPKKYFDKRHDTIKNSIENSLIYIGKRKVIK